MESLFGEQFKLSLGCEDAWLDGVLESINAGSTSSLNVSGDIAEIVGFLLEFSGLTIGDCRTFARGFGGAFPIEFRAWCCWDSFRDMPP